jgi:uncharacterized protein (TIGR00369 family)
MIASIVPAVLPEGGKLMDSKRAAFLKKDYLQGFPAYCGFVVTHVDFGQFETRLNLRRRHLQQDGFAHAGLIATMADHTAGYASFTTVSDSFRILTIEFKINFFKPGKGEALICRSRIVNNGKRIKVTESEVFAVSKGKETLISKSLFTQMAVPAETFVKT